MANALDAVLSLAAQHQAQQQQNVDNFTTGINSFNAQVQQAKQNQLQQLQIRAGLAQSGLQLNPNGSIQFNQNYINPNTQLQTLLAGQAAAKTAQNPTAYALYTNAFNRMAQGQPLGMPNNGQQPSVGSAGFQQTPVGQVLAPSPQGQGISPNVAPPQNNNALNQFLTTSRNVSVDPTSGVPTVSETQVNPAAKSIETIEGAKDAALGAANTQYAQDLSQLGLEAGQLSQINKLHQNLSNAKLAGYPGATLASSVGKLGTSPQLQSDLGQLNSSIENYGKSALIASTSEPGVGGAKRGGTSTQLLQQDTPHSELEGNIKGLLWSGYEKTLATNKYNATLAAQGTNPASQTPQQKQAAVYAQMGQMTDAEKAIGQNLIDRTLYTGPTNFKSEAQVGSAKVPSGMIITINGRRARVN